MPSDTPTGESYNRPVGLMYLFNLIVGTGALTMPFAFYKAGWLLSVMGVCVLCFMSYLTATFMIESMAASNAIFRFKTLKHYKKVSNQRDTSNEPEEAENDLVVDIAHDIKLVAGDEGANNKATTRRVTGVDGVKRYDNNGCGLNDAENFPPPYSKISGAVESVAESSSVDYFAITESFEMSKMATMYYSPWGVRLFYLCIAVYLYGDLAIYSAAVAKSIRDIACEKRSNLTSVECWPKQGVNRSEAYRIFLVVFTFCVGPFTFFNLKKTLYLQLFTSVLRWIAFISMITLCVIAISRGTADAHPSPARILELPSLFGVCVYSFMCHHSLPSIITPIHPKKGMYKLMAADFLVILIFYNLLSLTGVFTFDVLQDMYTLNFEPTKTYSVVPVIPFMQYFLALFPVLTLSSNFPIIAITLRNNLRTLLISDTSPWFVTKLILPLAALVPPVLIALAVEDIDFLVGFTGAYAGAMIQYIIPASLVFLARREVLTHMGVGVKNTFSSPFRSRFWVFFVVVWTIICIVFVSAHLIMKSTAAHVPSFNSTLSESTTTTTATTNLTHDT